MSNEEIAKWLANANQYGGGAFGTSFADSYRNAAAFQNRLGQLEIGEGENQISQEDYDMINAGLRAQKGQAVAGGVVAGLTGATSILTGATQAAQIRDTSVQEGQIADLYNAGNYNYNNYDQLANDYAQTNFNPVFGENNIRGMNTMQKVGTIGTSALTGATTGLQIGGPWGAVIGGVLGAGAGVAGVLAGDDKAQMRQQTLQLQAGLASDAAHENFAAAHERIGDNNHRQQVSNVVARGGAINRYIDKTLMHEPKQVERKGSSSKIMRVKGDGGVTIRIKK